MNQRSFGALFGPYLPTVPLSQALLDGIVENMDMHHATRRIVVDLQFEEYIKSEELRQVEQMLLAPLQLQSAVLRPHYAPELFTVECCEELVAYLKTENVAVNGTFDDAVYEIDGDVLRITLSHGGLNILETTGADHQLQQLILQQFGLRMMVEIKGEVEAQKDERYQKMMEQAEQEAAARAREEAIARAAEAAKQPKAATADEPARPGRPNDPTRPPEDGLPIYLETAQPLLGTPIKERPVPIKGLEADGSTVTVWGQVFRIESKDNRDGSKCRYSISITDLTSSVLLTLWLDKKRDKDKINAVSGLKVGDNLVASGRYEYDEFLRANVLRPRSMSVVARYQRQDLADEKRVELHMHTKMSSMDAVAEAKDLVKRAAAWGHKAVAITDHGVVQAFPDIMNAADDLARSGKNIKILYGMEAYYVNDMVPAVNGSLDLPLDSECIVFDIETTGLSVKSERITEIGAVRMVGGEVKESFNTFINPGIPIPAKITELTGITNAMVADAPSEEEGLRKFYDFCGNCRVLVAHNASFDTGFIRAAARRCHMPYDFTAVDTFRCPVHCIKA